MHWPCSSTVTSAIETVNLKDMITKGCFWKTSVILKLAMIRAHSGVNRTTSFQSSLSSHSVANQTSGLHQNNLYIWIHRGMYITVHVAYNTFALAWILRVCMAMNKHELIVMIILHMIFHKSMLYVDKCV